MRFRRIGFYAKTWPDFAAAILNSGGTEFGKRERARGALPDAIAG